MFMRSVICSNHLDEERLTSALNLVQQRLAADRSSQLAERMQHLFKTFDTPSGQFRKSFLIKEKGFENEVFVEDILYMEAQGNYVKLCTSQRDYLFRIAMNILEAELNPQHFP